MKKVFFISLFFFGFITAMYANGEVNVSSKLKEVKVFLRGAELTHTVKLRLNKGVTDVVIDNIANNINQQSIQVSGKGSAAILSVFQRVNFLKPTETTLKIKELQDSLKILNREIKKYTDEKSALYVQKDVLISNKDFSSDTRVPTLQELERAVEYFKNKILGINLRISEIDEESERVTKRIELINKQLNTLNAQNRQGSNEVVVTLSANAPTEAELTLTYQTWSAGWKPFYDIKVADINTPVQLIYKANVQQSTGLEWKDVKLIISTRNTAESNAKPGLIPWYLNFFIAIPREISAPRMEKGIAESEVEDKEYVAEALDEVGYGEFAQNETGLSLEYIPTLNYTIPSDSKEHLVIINEEKMEAAYSYFAVPKYDKNAFLIAEVDKWYQYNLLPGSANIYYENAYVGQTFIHAVSTEEKLQISLGRDKNIIVEKKLLKDFAEDKFLSSNVERFFAYDIIVRNNKKQKVDITIEDQLPIPQHEDIEVELIDKSDAELNKDNKFLTWKVSLETNGTVTKKLVYSVKYPGDKPIQGL